MKLSIIMPCYNCSTTINEAVNSIYKQNLQVSFEVILVDDNSKDNTQSLIKELEENHENLKSIFHDKNQGGGAARNTAVKHSQGELIFCLDSDDILPENMLQKMINHLESNSCDGVAIGKSLFFVNKISNIVNTVEYEEKNLSFPDLFTGRPISVIGNFLYTRKAYDQVNGYPADHGFDTQGFGFRIMANNLKIQVCKDAFYYQRIPIQKSYYVREIEAGNLSKNWFYILNENLYKFSETIQKIILQYDYKKYDNNTSLKNISKEIKKHENIFNINMLKLNDDQAYSILKLKNDTTSQYWAGIYSINKNNYSNAHVHFNNAQKLGFNGWQLYHYQLSSLYLGKFKYR